MAPAGPQRFLMPVIMAGIMAFVMTAIITIVNLGGVPADFLARWMRAFLVAWPIAAVTAFFALPLARSLTGAIVARLPGSHRPS